MKERIAIAENILGGWQGDGSDEIEEHLEEINMEYHRRIKKLFEENELEMLRTYSPSQGPPAVALLKKIGVL